MMTRLTLTALLLTACGERQPGPAASEHGAIFYWEVIDSSAGLVDCTDNPSFTDGFTLTPIPTGTYILYRVDDTGDTAMGQNCDTTDPATCTDSGHLWNIEDHDLVFDPPVETVELDTDCDQTVDDLWVFNDGGLTGTLDVSVTFGLTGNTDTCAAIDAEIAAGGTNGEGLDGCTLTMNADLAFYSAD